ncbi:MAG: hypothetical protein JKX71_06115 [Amylibacter sp.]|nr:hypothetical protein [Amylibacter sp.]
MADLEITNITDNPEPQSRTTYHRLIWNEISITIRYTCNAYGQNFDHLEIKSVEPEYAPLPFTETGYKSHYVPEHHIADMGGAVAYVQAWLAETAKAPVWQAQQAAARQLSLF